jgi:hypothetical protein
LATFYIVIITLVLLNAYTSKKEAQKSLSPVATQKTEASQEKTETAPTSVPIQKTETLQEKTEKTAPPVEAEKARQTEASSMKKSIDKVPVQVDQAKSQPSPSKPVVPLSLNEAMSAQEQVIRQKVSGVLDLLGQLKQHLESDEAGSKDVIRNRLKAIHQVADENEMQRREIQSHAMFSRVCDFFASNTGDMFCVAIYSSLLNRMFEVQVTRQQFAAFGGEAAHIGRGDRGVVDDHAGRLHAGPPGGRTYIVDRRGGQFGQRGDIIEQTDQTACHTTPPLRVLPRRSLRPDAQPVASRMYSPI